MTGEGKLRDMRVADDVGQMYALGRFDREFAAYGCAYLSAGKNHYIVSAQPERIYDFVESARAQGVCTSAVKELHESCAVPSGTQEAIAQRVKKKLAAALRDAYPQEFMLWLERYSQSVAVNEAEPWLRVWQDQLEGVFDGQKLDMFAGMLLAAYDGRVLDAEAYRDFSRWLALNREDMADDVVVKDILEAEFYGIAYEQDGRLRYVVNTHREVLYKRKFALEQEGVWVTPLWHRTCCYNYRCKLQDAREDFAKSLRECCDAAYMHQLKTLKKRRQPVQDFPGKLAETQALYGEEAQRLLRYYGHIWGLL